MQTYEINLWLDKRIIEKIGRRKKAPLLPERAIANSANIKLEIASKEKLCT